MNLNQASLAQLRTSGKEMVQAYPERVLQVGDGIFLRGFVDWLVHRLNTSGVYQGRVVMVKPRNRDAERVDAFNEQDGLYTVWVRGLEHGDPVDEKEVVTSVSRMLSPYDEWNEVLACARNPDIDILVSNTTEAGLAYANEDYIEGRCPESFPAKVTAYLYERYRRFNGNSEMGLDVVPCELVEDNGAKLQAIVLRHIEDWGLPQEFANWVVDHNYFYNTLVDSIVTGFPTIDSAVLTREFPYRDAFGVVREPFYFWVIQGPQRLQEKWDFAKAGLNVKYVPDVAPFRLTKVRILNGAHTALAGLAFLAGIQTVKEAITHPVLSVFVERFLSCEVLPTLASHGVQTSQANEFATAVLERFSNPYLRHEIVSLQLNALSKVTVRLLPTLHDSMGTGVVDSGVTDGGDATSPCLSMALAGQLFYYRNADHDEDRWEIRDNPNHVRALQEAWDLEAERGLTDVIETILSLTDIWGEDLSQVSGLTEHITSRIQQIREFGVINAISEMLSET